MATTTITYGPADKQTSVKLTPGDIVNIETANGAQVLGTFVSLSAAKGVRIHNGRAYVTRRPASIVNITVGRATELSDEDVAAELPAAAPVEDRTADSFAPSEAEIEARAAEVEAFNLSQAEAAREENHAPGGIYGPPAPARQAADDAAAAEADAPAPVVTDVFDADPMVDGRKLSEMKFAEVMVLAKKYRTPGRGVARIAALREGVARAIHAEVSARIAADAALKR